MVGVRQSRGGRVVSVLPSHPITVSHADGTLNHPTASQSLCPKYLLGKKINNNLLIFFFFFNLKRLLIFTHLRVVWFSQGWKHQIILGKHFPLSFA